MKKFEYKWESIKLEPVKEYHEYINKLGSEGWELINLPVTDFILNDDYYGYCVFKREIPPNVNRIIKLIDSVEFRESIAGCLDISIDVDYNLDEDLNEIPFDNFNKEHALDLIIKEIKEWM